MPSPPALVLRPPFHADGGQGWYAPLPAALRFACDTDAAPRRSPLVLLEDDRALGPRHTVHAEIRAAGEGRHSFWEGTLYFSTSDGSDPNRNGRRYAVGLVALAEQAPVRPVPVPYPLAAAPPDGLRLGVLGTGQRGAALARVFAAVPGVAVTALCDALPHRAAFVAAGLTDTPTLAQDAAALFAVPGLQAVVIATPDHQHRAQAEAALAAGLHVFLDKPVATRAADAVAILAAARQADRVLHVGFVLRHAPFFLAVREALAGGALGTLRSLTLTDGLLPRNGASYFRRWHRDPALSGGMLVHKGCHDLDLVLWLLGRMPVGIASQGGAAVLTARDPPAPGCAVCPEAGTCPFTFAGESVLHEPGEMADPHAAGLDRCVFSRDHALVERQEVLLDFGEGLAATYALDLLDPAAEGRRLRVVGTAGVLEGRLQDGWFSLRFDDDRPPERWAPEVAAAGGHARGDAGSVAAFLAAVTAGCSDWAALEAAALGLVVAEAAETARQEGRVVRLGQARERAAA